MGLNIVKAKIIESGRTMSRVVEEGHLGSVQNLSNKLCKGTLRYTEAEEIAEICGYNIVWEKKADFK